MLVIVTLISLITANSAWGEQYLRFWQLTLGPYTILEWVNDGLMAIFFLFVGLELQKEFYSGTLSNFKNGSLPVIGALGGMILPATIYAAINYGKPTISGAGIPTATDIAFSVGILSLLGKRVPFSLKVFLTALAVADDLGAIIVIAFFYSSSIVYLNLLIALGIFLLLLGLNRLKVKNVWVYLLGGVVMWYFMHHSGVHATIAGVLLAFTIPLEGEPDKSLSYRIQHFLDKPVAFFIMPLFALANTAISLGGNFNLVEEFTHTNSLGIIAGLVLGKPLGITLFAMASVAMGFCSLPKGIRWREMLAVSMLAGIGFTMSIFVTLLSFDDDYLIKISKIAILLGSSLSAIFGYIVLNYMLKKREKEFQEMKQAE